MAKGDFLQGFLKGLYQSGVGNPEVQRANEAAVQDRNAALGSKMAEQGMVPGELAHDHPMREKIGSFISSMFGGATTRPTLASQFKPDPTQPQYAMGDEGRMSMVPPGSQIPEGMKRIAPRTGESMLANQFKNEADVWAPTTAVDAQGNTILLNKKTSEQKSMRGGKPVGATKPPTGFRWTSDGQLEVVPGGPADLKSRADQEKKDLALAGQIDKSRNVLSLIQETIPKISGMSAGGMAGTANIPMLGQMTGAKDLQANLTTIKANLGFDQLAEMKNQSKAGASGLGALSEREMDLLVSARRNLDQAQTPEQLKNRLGELVTHYQNWLSMEQGKNPYTSSPMAQPSAQTPTTSSDDQQAIAWAKANPLDPRAIKIMQMHR